MVEKLQAEVGISYEEKGTLLMENEMTKDFLYTLCELAKYDIDKKSIIKDIVTYVDAYYERTERRTIFYDEDAIYSLNSIVSIALNEVIENDDLDACVYIISRYIRRNYVSKKYLRMVSK